MHKYKIKNKTFANPIKLVKNYFTLKTVFKKLKEIVENRFRFEEESMLYTYQGNDKNEIWLVMEFFYSNLWNKEFRKFNFTDPTDEWENYNFYVHYKGKYSLVSIIYGIGSTCIIVPIEKIEPDKLVLDLDNIKYNIFGEIYERKI